MKNCKIIQNTAIGLGTVGALLSCLYVVYDTQMMLGGQHRYALDPEDYVFASLNLYLDVINIFLYALIAAFAWAKSK